MATKNYWEYIIQKNPKTDQNHLKKSHNGLCYVTKEDDKFVCHDGYTYKTIPEDNLFITVFKDGKLVREDIFNDIRNRLNGENND